MVAPPPALDDCFAIRQTGLLKVLAGGRYRHEGVGFVKKTGDAYSFHGFAFFKGEFPGSRTGHKKQIHKAASYATMQAGYARRGLAPIFQFNCK